MKKKLAGSNVWWVRYADATGRIRREKVGNKGSAIKLYSKRKTEVMQRIKLPENFKAKPVEMQELINEAMEYSRNNNRGYSQDRLRLLQITKEFGSRTANLITPQEIERWLTSEWMERGNHQPLSQHSLSSVQAWNCESENRTESNPAS